MAMIETMKKIGPTIRRFCGDEKGTTAIEYTLIIGLIFLVIIAGVRAYSESASEIYSTIQSGIAD